MTVFIPIKFQEKKAATLQLHTPTANRRLCRSKWSRLAHFQFRTFLMQSFLFQLLVKMECHLYKKFGLFNFPNIKSKFQGEEKYHHSREMGSLERASNIKAMCLISHVGKQELPGTQWLRGESWHLVPALCKATSSAFSSEVITILLALGQREKRNNYIHLVIKWQLAAKCPAITWQLPPHHSVSSFPGQSHQPAGYQSPALQVQDRREDPGTSQSEAQISG